MTTKEITRKEEYEVKQQGYDYGLASIPLPPELLQQIFGFLPREAATLNLVCKEWRVLLSSMYRTLTSVQWPHLFEQLDPSTPWALYYTKKMIVEGNLRDCRITTHSLKAPPEAHYNSEIYHLSRRRIALLRLCPNLIPVFPFIFPQQLDIINLENGKILKAIEILNQFHIKDNVLYVDVDNKIYMYDIDTCICKGYFEGHIGQVVQLYVDRFRNLYALTKKPNKLFSWNLETAEFHKYTGNGHLNNGMKIFEANHKTIVLKKAFGRHNRCAGVVAYGDKDSKSIFDEHYFSRIVTRQILHEGLEIQAREAGWVFFVGEGSTDDFTDKDHIIKFVITEPNRLITLTHVENGNETHVQFWDIEKRAKIKDVEVNDPDGLLARATIYEIFRPSEERILIVGNMPQELYEFIAVVNLSDGTFIEQKIREHALDLPPSDEVTFTHFDNQIVTFIASKATSEMPNRELVIRVVKFDGTDDAEIPSDRTLEMGTSVDLDSFKKGTLTTSTIAFETLREQHSNQKSPSIAKYTNKGYTIYKGVMKVLSYGFAIGAALASLVMMGVQFLYNRLTEPLIKNQIGHQK